MGRLVYDWVTFSLKFGTYMGPISDFQQHVPTKIKLMLPSGCVLTFGTVLLSMHVCLHAQIVIDVGDICTCRIMVISIMGKT